MSPSVWWLAAVPRGCGLYVARYRDFIIVRCYAETLSTISAVHVVVHGFRKLHGADVGTCESA